MMDIDQKALQITKEKCHIELDKMMNKYYFRQSELILNYLVRELKNHFIWACLGLVFVFGVMFLVHGIEIFCVSSYFLFLGFIALYEQVKNRLYHMDELLETCCLQSGKRFLYKTLSITLLQLIYFLLIYVIFPISQYQFMEMILYTLCPIYISQIFSLYFVYCVYHVFSCFIVYFTSYFVVLLGIRVFMLVQLMTLFQCFMIGCFIFMIYLCLILYLYDRKEKLLWN